MNDNDAVMSFYTLEEHINTAIFYCSAALNKLILENFKGCECDNSNEDDLKTSPSNMYGTYALLFVLIALPSLITTISAIAWIATSSKMPLLKKVEKILQ